MVGTLSSAAGSDGRVAVASAGVPGADLVIVEPVDRGKPLVRVIELPQAVCGDDARWAPPVMAWERYRFDARRHPYFERGEAQVFLARRMGRPAGRITAHVPDGDEGGGDDGAGRFGFWWAIDDADVAAALLDAACGWLDARGCTSMVGPLSYEAREEVGLQVAGHDVPGLTGRPWHPPHLARLLEGRGAEPHGEHPTWRLDLDDAGVASHVEQREAGTPVEAPGHAGPYGDTRLVLPGIAAVPDVAGALRTAGVRSAWALARRARARTWEVATVVRCDGDPATLVPGLLHAAAAAGYRQVIAPWTPVVGNPPEAVHRTYRITW
jgi:hypothetical protein